MLVRQLRLSAVFFLMALFFALVRPSLAAEAPILSEQHKAAGLGCNDCHGTGEKKPVPMSKCLECHESYAKVAARTQHVDPNPHQSHLVDLPCTKCHLGHKPRVIYCMTCHSDMEFKKQ